MLLNENASFGGHDGSQCIEATVKPKIECCNFDTYMWEGYNANVLSCCQDGVKPIGTC